MADATVIDRLRPRAVLLAERPDGRGVRGVVLVRRPDPRKPVTVPGRMVKLRSSTAISPRASWSARGLRSSSTLLFRRVSTRLRTSPDPTSARSSNWAYCTCSTRQTTKPAIARPPVVSAERRASAVAVRLPKSQARCLLPRVRYRRSPREGERSLLLRPASFRTETGRQAKNTLRSATAAVPCATVLRLGRA